MSSAPSNSPSQDPREYFERKRIPQILESITTGLVFQRPDDPLDYIEKCISKLRTASAGQTTGSTGGKGGVPPIIPWNQFLPELEKGKTHRPSLDSSAEMKKLPVLPAISSPKSLVAAPSVAATAHERAKTRGKAWKNIVFVLGGPGSGKGTQCERLSKEFRYVHLSAGDLLRAEVATGSDLGKKCDILMKEGKIVPLEITVDLLRKAMDAAPVDAEGFLIDGFPRKLDQAEYFEREVATSKFVLCFDCPEELLERRLLKRGETSGRADDNLATIKKRFQTFVETSMPVIEKYSKIGKCYRVSSEHPVDVVYHRTKLLFSHEPLNHPNVVFVLGGPGSGKGTNCERLAKDFNLCHISTGDLLRAQVELQTEIGRTAQSLMKEGKMVPLSMVLGLVRDRMIANLDAPGFLLDGYPREVEQAIEFERTIGPCRKVVYFNCPLNVLERRLLERGKSSGRADDNIDTIKKRFKTFQDASLPVIEYYRKKGPADRVIEISSDQVLDAVYAEAKRVFTLPFDGEHIVFVLGGPGSGKGTQCAEIVERLGYAHLSTGDLLREEVKRGTALGKKLEADMREGKMVPLDITVKLLLEAMERARGAPGYLIDGFPRTLEQADMFEKTIGKCSFVLYFECSKATLTQRLLKRGETSGRSDDNEASIAKRLATFDASSMPVIDLYTRDGRVKAVNSEGNVDNVTVATMDCFK